MSISPLLWAGITVGVLILIFVVKILVINPLWYAYQLSKILYVLPPMRWLSLEGAEAEFGISKRACESVLPDLHEKEIVEIRPKSDLSSKDLKSAARGTFNRYTIELYEFRLVHRGRRRRIPFFKRVRKFLPNFEPPATPA